MHVGLGVVTFSLTGYIFMSVIAELYGKCVFTFLRNCWKLPSVIVSLHTATRNIWGFGAFILFHFSHSNGSVGPCCGLKFYFHENLMMGIFKCLLAIYYLFCEVSIQIILSIFKIGFSKFLLSCSCTLYILVYVFSQMYVLQTYSPIPCLYSFS